MLKNSLVSLVEIHIFVASFNASIRSENLRIHIQTPNFLSALMNHTVRIVGTPNLEVVNMKQATISEMRSYDRPPIVVEKVIRATFTVLGDNQSAIDVLYLYSLHNHANFTF